jgi:hypothetical protein
MHDRTRTADGVTDKVSYMMTDLARWAQEFNIPWKDGLPDNYPFKATTLKVGTDDMLFVFGFYKIRK